jgi:hypothetical protein
LKGLLFRPSMTTIDSLLSKSILRRWIVL